MAASSQSNRPIQHDTKIYQWEIHHTSSSQSANGRILITASAFFREHPFINVNSSTVATLKNSRTWTVDDFALNKQIIHN